MALRRWPSIPSLRRGVFFSGQFRPRLGMAVLTFQFVQEFKNGFLTLLWWTGVVHVRPAAHILGQQRIEQRVELWPRQSAGSFRIIVGAIRQRGSPVIGFLSMIAPHPLRVVNWKWDRRKRASVAGFAQGGLEGIELGVALAAETSLRGLAVEIGAGAVIQGGL